MTSDSRVALRWSGRGLSFLGSGASGPEIVIDGDSVEGPSPPEALLLSLAGCMAVDVKLILEKGRVSVDRLDVAVEGDRADGQPRRYTGVRIRFELLGPGEDDRPKVRRAVDLSRDKYCSVLHTLRPDLDLQVETEVLRS